MIQKLGSSVSELSQDDLDDRLSGNSYHRPNDKWVEVPVQTLSQDGETKTITVRRRSLRSKRRIFTLSCTAFTAGLLIILMSSPYSNEFLVPGGLSSNHGQILAGHGADRCAACHGAADGSLASWISSTISIGKAEGLSQSELCMKCHDKSFANSTALNPHNIAPDELAKVTQKYHQASFDAGMVFSPPVHGGEIACSACHREHHGSDNDLTLMTDRQCQTCHQNSFHSFETDHPEFENYPLKRRSRIAFDHSSHAARHFPGKNIEFNCSQCHIDDSMQNVKVTASFEQACASCHNQQIVESGSEGLAVVALPMIDTNAVEDAKLNLGTWPLAATGDFDGKLPPIMRLLLTADEKAASVFAKYGSDFEFSDIDPEEVDQVADAVELAWAIKRLLYDLALNGPRTVRSRIESVLDLQIADDELKRLVDNLDEQVFQNAVRTWLPNLTVEVAANRYGASDSALAEIRNATPDLSNEVSDSDDRLVKNDAWWWPSEEVLARIAPVQEDELLAPNPLAGLMESSDTIVPLTTGDGPVDGLNDQAGTETNPAQDSRGPLELNNLNTDVSDDPALLAVNPLSVGEGNTIGVSAPPRAHSAGSNANSSVVPKHVATKQPNNILPDKNKFPATGQPPLVVPSGWFRNDQSFQISYRPSGHSDDCLESWIELAAKIENANARPETKSLFDKTLSMAGIGLCRTCHTVDQLPEGNFNVNWKSEYRDLSKRSFTEFSHGPHLIQPKLQDCSHCHQLDLELGNAESFVSLIPDADVSNTSNFLPITKSNCTNCHQPKQAGSGCTQCHNYHVGTKVTKE